MNSPKVVSREEFTVARKKLLESEKELSHVRDRVNAERRALPMVEIDKDYVFDGPDGPLSLLGLFEGRKQLIVYHFMMPPGSDHLCPGCTMLSDNVGHLAHLHDRDTTFVAVARAPLAEITPVKERMGWVFPWYSSEGSDFNYDFHVSLDADVAPIEYNYRTAEELEAAGLDWMLTGPGDWHGLSVFLRRGKRVYHTYSTYARGTDLLNGTFNYLDLTPLGRQGDGFYSPSRTGKE
ncbi:Predicted dithiol-disulfide oxidoreductase, DUF899 family [Amycolatopsis xylanica]|uniref:Predicted dithiol-disulfide oxidoreductase, DUF899 family n=1 Tax=Amycolatopsis xylanica TaxID=589385 RepID=A0A1H3DTG2_9PSEU|nr:DUF899 domain-containing protein [Amycolatopsis xylanica]SDX69627.1 Predicted dithiol-disulfide oxidoreductase, DUF899 family [Amycolatopsis xylanica]